MLRKRKSTIKEISKITYDDEGCTDGIFFKGIITRYRFGSIGENITYFYASSGSITREYIIITKMQLSKKQRTEILNKFDSHCAYCGCLLTMQTMQVDHIIPQARFKQHVRNKQTPAFLTHLTENDAHHTDNLFPSCRACNYAKDTFAVGRFRKEINEKLATLRKTFNYRLLKNYGFVYTVEKPVTFYFETYKK